jgi:hypothetical protein
MKLRLKEVRAVPKVTQMGIPKPERQVSNFQESRQKLLLLLNSTNWRSAPYYAMENILSHS